jgi:hypothetical protein
MKMDAFLSSTPVHGGPKAKGLLQAADSIFIDLLAANAKRLVNKNMLMF